MKTTDRGLFFWGYIWPAMAIALMACLIWYEFP
jgi:hypothetical protein